MTVQLRLPVWKDAWKSTRAINLDYNIYIYQINILLMVIYLIYYVVKAAINKHRTMGFLRAIRHEGQHRAQGSATAATDQAPVANAG